MRSRVRNAVSTLFLDHIVALSVIYCIVNVTHDFFPVMLHHDIACRVSWLETSDTECYRGYLFRHTLDQPEDALEF